MMSSTQSKTPKIPTQRDSDIGIGSFLAADSIDRDVLSPNQDTNLIVQRTPIRGIKRTRKSATNTPSPLFRKRTTSTRRSPFVYPTEDQQRKSKTIAKTMHRFRHKITANYLGHVCVDSGECLMFGAHTNKIGKFFNNFVDFTYATPKWSRMPLQSANGIVTIINYERETYTASAILKLGIGKTSDNLVYEYLVGLVVNQFVVNHPCFLETYGLFKMSRTRDASVLERFKIGTDTNIRNYPMRLIDDAISNKKLQMLSSSLLFTDHELFDTACAENEYITVLSQFINGAISLKTYLQTYSNKEVFTNIWCILYQIYYSLEKLQEQFTHHDLHFSNVLLVSLPQGKYMRFRYNNTGIPGKSTVEFKCRWVVKIIDYGRSFVKHLSDDDMSSTQIMKTVCDTSTCNTTRNRCGRGSGFKFGAFSKTFSNPETRNVSADLRLARMTINQMYSKMLNNAIVLQLNQSLPPFNLQYGTEEKRNRGQFGYINNVSDMHYELTNIVSTIQHINRNELMYNSSTADGLLKCMGTLTINGDSPAIWKTR